MSENLKNMPCYDIYEKFNKTCNKKECRYWQDLNGKNNNCIINTSSKKEHTLQEIGEILNITRMRVCQIEKSIYKKINKI